MRDGLFFAGFMCGTSLDGVDGALVHIYQGKIELLAYEHHPFSPRLTGWIREILSENMTGKSTFQSLGDLEHLLSETETSLTSRLCSLSSISPSDIDGAGTHGITAYHRPSPHVPSWENPENTNIPGITIQISNPYRLSRKYGIPVVYDFRRADVSVGGEGAPLATLFHRAAFSDPHENRAFLNLGGIANLTYLPAFSNARQTCLSFDTGPGNMLLDLAMSHITHGEETYDKNGQRSASGTVQKCIQDFLLDDPWFSKPPPKSTGREDWGEEKFATLLTFLKNYPFVQNNDLLASLAETSAAGVLSGFRWLDSKPDLLILGGGGSYNVDLRRRISRITGVPTTTTERFGWPPQAIESMAFAYLAALTLSGRPASLPSTTGCPHAVIGGSIVPPQNGSLPARLREICLAAEIHLPFPDRATPPESRLPGSGPLFSEETGRRQ